MLSLSKSMVVLLLMALFGACASVQSGGWADPIPQMQASVMTAKTCSAPLVIDPSPNVNQGGWKQSTKGCSPSSRAFSCDSGACGQLSVGTVFRSPGQERHFVVDVIAGQVEICVEPAQRFGVGLDCPKTTHGPGRAYVGATVPDAGTSGELVVRIKPVGVAPVLVGNVFPAEPR